MLYYAEAELDVDAGVMITGSHNPADYNGFKMVLFGRAFFGADIQALGAMAAAGDWESGTGAVRDEDDAGPLRRTAAAGLRRRTAIRIGWDAGNGAAGPALEKLVAKLPGEHHLLYTEVDSRFPNHHPDPTEEANLADLKALVAEKGLDFGIAFDGDGDRIGAVDGEGRVVWGDQLLAILAEPVLKAVPGATIIADVKASQTLYDRIAALGGKPLMWKTGHSLIKSKMKETGAPLAGEMSGHIFFAHDYYGFDDALYAAVRLIRAVTELGGSLTALKSALPAVIEHAGNALSGRREPQVRGGRRSARPARGVRRHRRPHGRRSGQHRGRLVAAARLQHPGRARGAGRGEGPGGPRPPCRPDRRAARSVRRRTRPAGGALMPRLHIEALAFCIAWAAVATLGFVYAGRVAGALLSVGLMLIVMPASALILSKTEDFALERQLRWGILAIAGLALAIWVNA